MEANGFPEKVAYYKGCLASLSAKELDSSTRALAERIGLELDTLESVTCCGAGDIHEAEPDYYLHLNARILAYAEATGAETLMTICNVCTLNLRQADFQLKKDDDLRARVNTNLETVGVPPYNGTIEVKHLLWLIADGDGYEACGGEPIDYPAKIKCCGFPIIQAREAAALGELIQPIEQAIEAGADAMVTPCPLCHLSLDAWQQKLEKATGREFRLPILHLAQLIGVAAGIEDSELKFKRHIVSVAPVLEKLQA